MATTLEIIRGIAQAAANAYDGAHDLGSSYEGGDEKIVGLKREEGHMINDRRGIDGFHVKFMGKIPRVTYTGKVQAQQG